VKTVATLLGLCVMVMGMVGCKSDEPAAPASAPPAGTPVVGKNGTKMQGGAVPAPAAGMKDADNRAGSAMKN